VYYHLGSSGFYVLQPHDFLCATKQLEAVRHNEIFHSLVGNPGYQLSYIALFEFFCTASKVDNITTKEKVEDMCEAGWMTLWD